MKQRVTEASSHVRSGITKNGPKSKLPMLSFAGSICAISSDEGTALWIPQCPQEGNHFLCFSTSSSRYDESSPTSLLSGSFVSIIMERLSGWIKIYYGVVLIKRNETNLVHYSWAIASVWKIKASFSTFVANHQTIEASNECLFFVLCFGFSVSASEGSSEEKAKRNISYVVCHRAHSSIMFALS